MSAIRTIYLPPLTLSYLRREIERDPGPVLKSLFHDPKIVLHRKYEDPVIEDNPLRGVPVDDIVEAMGFNWTLSPPEPHERTGRRRPAGATCSIRIVDMEPPK